MPSRRASRSTRPAGSSRRSTSAAAARSPSTRSSRIRCTSTTASRIAVTSRRSLRSVRVVKRDELREAQRPLKERYRDEPGGRDDDAARRRATSAAMASSARCRPARRSSTRGCIRRPVATARSRARATCSCRRSWRARASRCVGGDQPRPRRDRPRRRRGRPRLPRHAGRRPRRAGRLHRDPPVLRPRVRRVAEELDKLLATTERYCVVYQTLAGGVPVEVSRG